MATNLDYKLDNSACDMKRCCAWSASCKHDGKLADIKTQTNHRDTTGTVTEQKPSMKKSSMRKDISELMLAGALYYLDCLLAFLLSLVVIPIFVPVLVILKFGKWLLRLYIRHKEDCFPLKEDDAVWQQDCPTNRHVIHALMVIEGAPNLEKLKDIISERLVFRVNENNERICPRMTQNITECLGQYVWKEEKTFSMDNHMSVWEGRLAKKKEELEDVISEIASLPLPENLPPWQFYIIPTMYEKPTFALLLRIHHSVGDGVALTRVFVNNLYDVPPVDSEPRKFSTKQRLYMWFKAMVVGPLLVIHKIITRADVSVVHGQALSGQKLVSWSQDVSLSLVKQVKNATGTTVNDVMVSCIAGALYDYLKRHGVAKPEDMWASVPVDIRANRKSLKVENKFALVFLRMPIVAENCLERLYAAKQRMDVIKMSAEPLITATTVTMLMMLPGWFSRPLIDFFSCKMSCVLSNIPGPHELLSLGGQVVTEGVFWPPQRADIGIGLSIFSYGGGIRVGIFADKNVIPNPSEVTKGFVNSFYELAKSLNFLND